ncbi:MAG TPA: helix-turn-helix transcriptional regulator [Terracidiphilus sp.]
MGEFLKARRNALKPEDVGLQSTGRRRTPGLRREELALIAGVGATWYTWLEQGRDISVSREFLERLSRSLRLSSNDITYLFSLAGHMPPEITEAISSLVDDVQAVLDGYVAGPAIVCNELYEVIAFNDVADVLYRFKSHPGPRSMNMIWRNFTDPYRKQLYVSWLEMAEQAVGFLRISYAKHKGRRDFEALISDLLQASPEFEHLWLERARRSPSSYTTPCPFKFHVPELGTLNYLSVRFTLPNRPHWWASFLTPRDEQTATALSSVRKSVAR